jgi:hypothetical protein
MRFLSLLASATLFGGMILFSFGFAPLVFKKFDVGEAERLLQQAFPRYYLFVLAIAALAQPSCYQLISPPPWFWRPSPAFVNFSEKTRFSPFFELSISTVDSAADGRSCSQRFKCSEDKSLQLGLSFIDPGAS